jgi:hypothetical protein
MFIDDLLTIVMLVQPTATNKPVTDPFESLFSVNSNRPTMTTRANNVDDMFAMKTSTQTKTLTSKDPFDTLFDTSTMNGSNTRQVSSQGDKIQRPKMVTNSVKPISTRAVFDEIEEFVM